MTTGQQTIDPATVSSELDAALTFPADGQFDQLRDFVDRAANGEIALDVAHGHAIAPDAKLPSGWYADLPAVAPTPLLQRTKLRPELLAGLLGLSAGLVVLLPLAFWWQRPPTTDSRPMSLVASAAPIVQPVDARVDLLAVKAVPLVRTGEHQTVADARVLMSDGDVLAARTVLSEAVAARDPDGLFLMAETYDPNILAAHRARGVGADTERARALYIAAQGLGHARAAARLQALR